MAIYGSYLAESANKTTSLSKEDITFMKECYLTTCIEMAEGDFQDEAPLQEGANMDMLRILMATRKKFKEASADCKKSIKAKDYKSAKKAIADMKKIVDDAKKEVKKLDAGAGSAVFGYFTAWIVAAARNIVWIVGISIGAGVGQSLTVSGMNDWYNSDNFDFSPNGKTKAGMIVSNIANVGNLILSIKNLIGNIKQFCNDLDNKDTSTAEALNLFRNQIMQAFGDLEKQIAKLDKIVDDEARKNK